MTKSPPTHLLTANLIVSIILGVLYLDPALAVPPCDSTPDPCFTKVADILEGRRQLLPTDDLLLTGTFKVDSEFFQDTDIWTLLTTNSKITSQSKFSPYAKVANIDSDTPEYNADSRTGRMFNMPNDVAVTVAPNGKFGNLQLIVKIKDHTGTYTFDDLIVGFSQNSVLQSIAMGDANGDGYDDLFVSFSGGEFGGVTIALTAKDVNDPSKGLETRAFGFVKDNCPYATMALGNLTKSAQGRTSFVGVITSKDSAGCALLSGRKPPLLCASLINQETLALDTDSTACISPPDTELVLAFDLAVGNFDSAVGDEAVWVIGFSAIPSTGPNIFTIDFTLSAENKLVPAVKDTLNLGFFPNTSDKVVVDSARLDWFGTSEQAVVGFNGVLNAFDASMLVLTFDNNLNITNKKNKPTRIVEVSQPNSFHDLSIGNFDNHLSDNKKNERDFNQEIAVFHHNSAAFFVDIYDVDVKNNFSLTEKNAIQVSDFEGQFPGKRRLTTGDLQGRSMRLGPPTKLTISQHSQPSVVLGMPAMHIDYIRDVKNLPITKPGSAPSVLNLTTLPTLFYSQYDADVKGENQSSNKSTTSYATSTKKTVSGKVSFGIPDIASVKASFTRATKNTHDKTVANKHNTYQSKEFDVSKRTGLSDFLWFTTKRFNVFYYQVLGQMICPQDPAITPNNCPEDEKLPLHVQFSGPDTISVNAVSGTAVEWYQPVTEPANVFSYPWNQAQLETTSPPGFSLLSSETWATDDSTSVVSINWEEGSTTSKTTGSTSTHSFDKSASASASVSIDGFGGGASAKVDYNSSNSVSTQNTSTASLGSSSGIQIAKPPFAMTGNYGYNGETYIFGQLPSTATLQKLPLDEQFKATGILTVASTVNPLGPNSGDWWKQAYTLPDIAVNHPQRWNWTSPLDPNQPDILTFNKANTVDPALSEFYFMRGLFITPLEANGKGPQRTNANEGEQLKIEARIYNYSLVDMPAGSTIRVRFFVQEWDNSLGDFTGLSTLIDEQKLDNLPGFNSGIGETPNWTMASTPFDTTGFGDQYLVFWVLVWMEDANGELLAEIEGHGLTGLPATNIDLITAVPIETYSNNVGFYKQPFFVIPSENDAEPRNIAVTLPQEPSVDVLSVEDVTVMPDTAILHQKVQVSALLSTAEIAPGSVQVFFYDGDPDQAGELFDVELIPYLRSNDQYLTRVAYKPASCGEHSIFVEAVSSAPGAEIPVFGSADFLVTVEPKAAIKSMILQIRAFDLDRKVARPLTKRLQRARNRFSRGKFKRGFRQLYAYIDFIDAKSGKSMTTETAEALREQASNMIACLRYLD